MQRGLDGRVGRKIMQREHVWEQSSYVTQLHFTCLFQEEGCARTICKGIRATVIY